MTAEVKAWLKKKGFKKKGNIYEMVDGDRELGFDIESGLCWVDDDYVYAMKKVETLEDVESLYNICGFDLDFVYVENDDNCSDEYYEDGNEADYPITAAWLAMSGFEKKDEHKWVYNQNETTVKYDTSTNKLSVIKGREGFEGKVKTEDFAREIIYGVFSE